MNLCTNELWKCGGTGAGSSLQALCNVLGVPISKVDLVGDEVGSAYFRKEFSRIGRYCSYDSVATFNVFRKFKQEDIFEFDQVQYITAYSEDMVEKEVVEEQPLLQKIYASGSFTEEIKNQVKELIKEPIEEDKINLKKILLAHYQQKKDLVKVKKQKEQEINEFIESLC